MQDQQPKPKHHYEYRLFSAMAVIAVGFIFLVSNLGINIPFIESSNWWAWLILLVALGPLTRAYEVFRVHGKVDVEAAHSLLVAGTIFLVAVMFLLGLDWQVWWPLFVILGGLYTLVRKPYRSSYWNRRRQECDDAGDATFRH